MNTKPTYGPVQLTVLCLILGCSGDPDSTLTDGPKTGVHFRIFKDASELENHLNGKWSIVSSVYDGTKIPEASAAGGRVDFEDGRVRLIGSVIEDALDCTLDVSVNPHRITMRAAAGAPLLQGIVEVDGDNLRLCYRMHAKRDLGFPSKFESSSGSGLMLVDARKGAD